MSDFLQVVKDNFTKEEYLSIEYALKFATEAHKNQYRRTGEEYINHPIQVALLVIDLGMDADTVIAAAKENGSAAFVIGEIRSGEKGVTVC